jgi:hypothetical protein
MPVDDVAARVAAVLSRAESLFAGPTDGLDAGGAIDSIGGAAEASRSIGSGSAELSGESVAVHGETAAAIANRLSGAAAAESDFVRRLAEASETHQAGRSHATALRAGAVEITAVLGPAVHIPAGEVAALRGLRNRVANMQELVARHSGESARLAGEIRGLEYPQN